MRSFWIILFFSAYVLRAEEHEELTAEKEPPLTIAPHDVPKLGPPEAVPKEAEIEEAIKALADIDKADVGLSATLSGHAFPPIPSAQQMSAGMITNHGLRRQGAL
ncbi:MAG TPA: hypothetical protein VEJ63_10220, partial [Planctomycetota bacterium]|nr:hypothetical protein [Planctomycetota bacterium]